MVFGLDRQREAVMFCSGLPGGSPGPHAQGTWPILLVAFLLALAVAGGLVYLMINAAKLA
jgi:hypothetical protein